MRYVDPNGREDELGKNEWDIYADKINTDKVEYTLAHMDDWTGKNIGEDLVPDYTEIVRGVADKHLGESYDDGNSCDEWVAKVLTESGLDPSDYHLGNTQESVAQHISDIKKDKSENHTAHNGFNVVFMGDGTKNFSIGHEHAGLLIVDDDNTVNFYDSSRNNEDAKSMRQKYNSVEAFQNDYAYKSFYYQ